jgi:cell division protein FtsQ
MKKLPLSVFLYVQIAMAIAVFGSLGWGAYATVVYVRTAPLFEVKKLAVSGLKRVEENHVIASAGIEMGTNIFAVNLAEIRERVEHLQSVHHAIVQRVLPDQIIIKVIERAPIGLARIRGEVVEFDSDAELLDLDPASDASFPILNGLRQNDPAGNAIKVGTYRMILEELGETELSEVHITDGGEVSVVSASDPLMINLGASDFRNRWIRYLQLKPQIQRQYPQAVRVDLRFKNQVIIRMRDDETSGMIVWGGERRTL